jgi:hypothetical protein
MGIIFEEISLIGARAYSRLEASYLSLLLLTETSEFSKIFPNSSLISSISIYEFP